ncbi:Putative stage IV sporulation protein YqfD [Coprococcus catus GD/7]|uniref:Putative stage IV sporulation protein YqfD n=1 Tax=Coprococcus catus GD/7 TaxID=717962 RepID=D4J856_9FIRM|nr:sporulation protein YqfD [Coprococcus catus]CBK80527.1 Putative stage IV sporulation protein YqfD [Coprococcus catus GD/7]
MSVVSNQVRCLVTGEETLRFVNLCRNNGIELRHLVRRENAIQMEIDAENFKKLRPLVRKTHVKIHILNRHGPAFFFYRHKRRWWFLLGMTVFAGMIYMLSLFVWQIDIDGNRKYTDALILQALAQMDVKTGCRKSEIDLPEIEEELRIMYNEITWVSASIAGTKLQIELREGDLKISGSSGGGQTGNVKRVENRENNPKTQNGESETDLPANLVADEDAIITNLVVRRGTVAVRYGDEVKKGDVLIEGKVYIYNEDETLKKVDYLTAEGDVFGKYQELYEKHYQRKHEVRSYTGKNYRELGVAIVGKSFCLPVWENILKKQLEENTLSEVWSWKKQFRLTPTFYLPFALEYTEYVPYENVVEEYTDEVIKKMAEEELQKYLNELEKKGVQIISNSVTISLDADGGHVKGTLILDGPIGKEVPISSEHMASTRHNE